MFVLKNILSIFYLQKNFTSKIEGLEKLNYHQRLERLGMYSMERRRERYLIINAWQQIENVKENILIRENLNVIRVNGDSICVVSMSPIRRKICSLVSLSINKNRYYVAQQL